MNTITLDQLREWSRANAQAVLIRPDGVIQTATEGEIWRARAMEDLVAAALNGQPDSAQRRGATLRAAGYESLAGVLAEAFDQAANGKGKERHAQAGEPFDAQVILEGAKRFGAGALLFQAFKKSEESQRLPYPAARRELLGAIVYLAAAAIHLERTQPVAANDNTATARANG